VKGATAFASYVRERPELLEWIRVKLEEAMSGAGQEQEVVSSGDDEAEGVSSSEGNGRTESSSIGSDSLGEGRHLDGELPSAAQRDTVEVTLDFDSSAGGVKA
jgi:hypothetical protein